MSEEIDEILERADLSLSVLEKNKEKLTKTIDELTVEGKYSSDEYRNSYKELTKLNQIIELISDLTKFRSDFLGLDEMRNDPDYADIIKDDEIKINTQLEETVTTLKPLILKPMPNDDKKAIVEIRPGVGGTEASIFAGNLFEMYTKYLKSKNIPIEVYSQEYDQDGIKEAVFLVDQADSFGLIRFEGGVHRVQRVPKTESAGRIHTSTASVVVIPESSKEDIYVDPTDLTINYYRSSGPGGQSVNTTDSAVRITHNPTGITVTCQHGKSQHKNKEMAMSILVSKLKQIDEAKSQQAESEIREQMIKGGDRSSKIRTYNFPQSRVTDHRIKKSWSNIPEIMAGDLDDIISSTSEILRKDPTKIEIGDDED